jgi:hypothetical protein
MRLVDFGLIYVGKKLPDSKKTWIKIKITFSWARGVKPYVSKVLRRDIDRYVRLFRGQVLDAEVETTITTSPTGKIHAYTPESK